MMASSSEDHPQSKSSSYGTTDYTLRAVTTSPDMTPPQSFFHKLNAQELNNVVRHIFRLMVCVLCMVITFLIVTLLMWSTVATMLTTKTPKLRLFALSVFDFDFSAPTLTATWNATFAFHNPHERLTFEFDDTSVALSYKSAELARCPLVLSELPARARKELQVVLLTRELELGGMLQEQLSEDLYQDSGGDHYEFCDGFRRRHPP